MKERDFQRDLVQEIKERFPGAIVMKNDASQKRGMPDLTILHKHHWAALECKKSKNASHRPGQDKRVEMLNQMSYASFVYPENKEVVLNDLERTFKT